jgi:predicted TIM-barrel fold metal-dependent hydrolase
VTESIIDFHSHYIDPGIIPALPPGSSPSLLRRWEALTDLDGQLRAMDAGGVDRRVLSSPPALLAGDSASLGSDVVRALNDSLARLASRHPDRISVMATIDAFSGESAAAEVERAVTQLGFAVVCVDCAHRQWLLDAQRARPMLETAASLGVSIFVHPVNPAPPGERFAQLGAAGRLLARGSEAALTVLALLRSDVLVQLPSLRIVVPLIAAAGLLQAALYDDDLDWHGLNPSRDRRRFFLDTMGLDPPSLRLAVDLVGADHVLVGTDYPIVNTDPSLSVIAERLDAAGIHGPSRRSIASETATGLLALQPARSSPRAPRDSAGAA